MKKSIMAFVLITCIAVWTVMGYAIIELDILEKNEPKTISEKISSIPTKEIEAHTVNLEEITTNLADGHYILVGFSFLTDTPETAEELKKREFQLNNYLVHNLSEVTHTQAKSTQFFEEFVPNFQEYINSILTNGDVLEVYITNKIVQ